jgi:hypothetical protein
MSSLTANDLKTRGVAAIEESLAGKPEALISVRGIDRFVVMEVAQYNYLRECELEAAVAHSTADIEAGRYAIQTPEQHVAEMMAEVSRTPVRKTPARKVAKKASKRTA